MKKIIRVIGLIIALIMATQILKRTENTTTIIYYIILMSIMFMGMEYVRRQGNKLYQQKADIKQFDEMDIAIFKESIAQMYKYLGYYIQPSKSPTTIGYDFMLLKDRKMSHLKCFKGDGVINAETVEKWIEGLGEHKKIRTVALTNQYFTEDTKERLTSYGVEMIERRELISLLEDTLTRKENTQKNTKVQET